MIILSEILVFTIFLLPIMKANSNEIHCDIQGSCYGQILRFVYSIDGNQCLLRCKNEESCNWFTYDSVSWICVLFVTCENLTLSKAGFHTGQKECQYSISNKLLVTTGFPFINGTHSEVIDLSESNKKCESWPDFPEYTSAATGALLKNFITEEYFPVICGGWNYADFNSNCYSIEPTKNKTTLISEISQLRWYSSGTVLSNCEADICKDFLWITGGAFHQRSTEWVNLSTKVSQPGPELPIPFDGHCVTKVGSDVLLTGGIGNQGKTLALSHDVFYYGPKMSGEKWLHGCATFIHNDKIHVVVAGGYGENGVLDLTEIWNVNSDEGWIQGPKLPHKCAYPTMVTSPNGNGIILLGCYEKRDAIYELSNTNGTFQWIEMTQKLQYPRTETVAMLIPDDLTNCST